MDLKIRTDKRLEIGDHVKCIDDDFQIGLNVNQIYTVKENEKNSIKGQNRKIQLREIRGNWNRKRFILV